VNPLVKGILHPPFFNSKIKISKFSGFCFTCIKRNHAEIYAEENAVAQYLAGEKLKVVWTELSTLS